MKIELLPRGKELDAGPRMFMLRLEESLANIKGVKIVDRNPDIVLASLRFPDRSYKRAMKIVRLDGCYYNLAYFNRALNDNLTKWIRRANGVIYQSRFSQKMCENILGVKSKRSTVIPNGISLDEIASVPAVKYKEKHVFAASAKWRETKRPKSIIKGFIESNIPDSRLVFIGEFDGKKRFRRSNIQYTGRIKQMELISYLKGANYFIHLCMIESCPNSVIEALACGLPVVHNNIGGTPELVGKNGIRIECDRPFRHKIIDQQKVDNIPRPVVAKGLKECASREWSIKRPDLDISVVAQRYYEFFKELLS